MLKRIMTLLTTLLLTTTLLAQPKAYHFTKGEQEMVVFGTMHLSKSDFFPLPEPVLSALTQSDALALELDMNDPEILSVTMQVIATHGMLGDKKLVDVIGDERMKKLKEVAGFEAAMFEQMRPWFIAMSLPIIQALQMGYEDKAVDEYLADKAKAQSIPVVALESAKEQFDIFVNLTPKEELALLDSVLSQDAKEQFEQMLAVWQHNDEKAAEELLNQMEVTLPTLLKTFVTDRNHRMVERAIKLNADKKRLFVGVGALHLYGKDGIVKLLGEKGYQLTK